MSLSLIESLAKLIRLSPNKLHETSRRLRAELGGAEWKLSLCLLATVRRRSYRELGFANITEYAEKALQLSGKKAGCLLGTARALEHLPLLSEAFREGRIGWGKLRAIRGLATPETEKQWLDFALSHPTNQVVRKVSLSPASWKRHQALQASLEGTPVATESAVDTLLSGQGSPAAPERDSVPAMSTAQADRPGEPLDCAQTELLDRSAGRDGSAGLDGSTGLDRNAGLDGSAGLAESMEGDEGAARGVSTGPAEFAGSIGCAGRTELAKPVEASGMCAEAAAPLATVDPASLLPSPPKTIRLVFELSPDEYALYERAESRLRAQARRRISRAKVLTKMSEAVLNSGTARSRAKHQVLIHSEAETGKVWYDTEKGPLPVDASVLNQALEERETFHPKPSNAQGSHAAQKSNRARKAIPNATLRSLFAQAGHQCQRCGARDALLDVHHTQPVSEGGDHRLKALKILCQACHSLTHEPDFATKPHWRAAKLANQRRPGSAVGGGVTATENRATEPIKGRGMESSGSQATSPSRGRGIGPRQSGFSAASRNRRLDAP